MLDIVKIGDEVLREKCKPVTEFDSALHMLLDAMYETLENAGLDEVWPLFDNGLKSLENFGDSLNEFRFAGVALFYGLRASWKTGYVLFLGNPETCRR